MSVSDDPRDLTLGKVNVSVATTPFPATCLQAFVPFYQQPRHQPFVARNAWKAAINGIKALKRLKGGPTATTTSSPSPTNANAKGNTISSNSINTNNNANSASGGSGGGSDLLLPLSPRSSAAAASPLRTDLVVASGHKGRILLWNADQLVSLNSNQQQHGGGIVTQLIVTNTRIISIVERDVGFKGLTNSGSDNEVFVWDMTTMQRDATLSGHDDTVACIAVDAENENHILSGSHDKTILEWLLPNPNPIARYGGHTSAVTQLCFVFGRFFLSGSADSTLKLWESTVKAPPRVAVSATSRPPRRANTNAGQRSGNARTDATGASSISNSSTTLLAEGGLQRTLSAKAVRFSGVREAAPLATMEGHMGQVSYIENMSEEGGASSAKRPGSSSSRLVKAAPDTATQRTVSMVSACNGGVVRCYSFTFEVDTSAAALGGQEGENGKGAEKVPSSSALLQRRSGALPPQASAFVPNSAFVLSRTVVSPRDGGMEIGGGHAPYAPSPPSASPPPSSSSSYAIILQWSNKAHRALVKDVCWDNHVIVSASLSDGVCFFNSNARATNKVGLGAGVRHLAIDAMRRLVVCGCENGQLLFYNYDGFYALGQHDHYAYKNKQEGATDDSVTLVGTFQPHLGNITGMLLERTIHGQWERLITTSSDGTFFIMDFDTNRDAKTFPFAPRGVGIGGGAIGTSLNRANSTAVLGGGASTRLRTSLTPAPPPPSQAYPPSTTLTLLTAGLIAPIAECGAFLLASGSGAALWDIAAMARRLGPGAALQTGATTAAQPELSSPAPPLNGTQDGLVPPTPTANSTANTNTNASSLLAGAAGKALSRQSTPPPDAVRAAVAASASAAAVAEGPLVTTCCYYPSLRKIAVGVEGGGVRLYPLLSSAPVATEDLMSPLLGFNDLAPSLLPSAADEDSGPGSPQRVFNNPNDGTGAKRTTAGTIGSAGTVGVGGDGEASAAASLFTAEAYIGRAASPMINFEGAMFPRIFSTEDIGGVVACGLERGAGPGAFRTGAVALLDLSTGRQLTPAYPLALVPTRVSLFGYTAHEERAAAGKRLSSLAAVASAAAAASGGGSTVAVTHYLVLVQTRSGEVVLLTATSTSRALVQQRIVVKEQQPYYPEAEAAGTLPMPLPFFASLDTVAHNPPCLAVLAVDKGLLRSLIVPTTSSSNSNSNSSSAADGPAPPYSSSSPASEVIQQCAMPFYETVSLAASLAAPVPVVGLAPLRLSGYLAAVALANGTVTIVSEGVERAQLPATAGPDLFREHRPIDIFHNGAVADYGLERMSARRQRRSYTRTNVNEGVYAKAVEGGGVTSGASSTNVMYCTAMTVSPHARLLGLGYRDGAVLLWDMATRRVTRRITANPSPTGAGLAPVLHISLFSRERRLLTIFEGTMRFDTLYGRNVADPVAGAADSEEQKRISPAA